MSEPKEIEKVLEEINILIRQKSLEVISLKSMSDFLKKSQTLKTEEVVKNE